MAITKNKFHNTHLLCCFFVNFRRFFIGPSVVVKGNVISFEKDPNYFFLVFKMKSKQCWLSIFLIIRTWNCIWLLNFTKILISAVRYWVHNLLEGTIQTSRRVLFVERQLRLNINIYMGLSSRKFFWMIPKYKHGIRFLFLSQNICFDIDLQMNNLVEGR